MNDVVSERRTVIEVALDIDENGMTTARKLYDWLGLAPQNYARWCKNNITENQFAEETLIIRHSSSMKNAEDKPQPITNLQLTLQRSYP